jgi:hypothetical protein
MSYKIALADKGGKRLTKVSNKCPEDTKYRSWEKRPRRLKRTYPQGMESKRKH